MEKAKSRNMPFNFEYLVLICKLYKLDSQKKKSKKNKNKPDEPEVIWSNAEEEVFEEVRFLKQNIPWEFFVFIEMLPSVVTTKLFFGRWQTANLNFVSRMTLILVLVVNGMRMMLKWLHGEKFLFSMRQSWMMQLTE